MNNEMPVPLAGRKPCPANTALSTDKENVSTCKPTISLVTKTENSSDFDGKLQNSKEFHLHTSAIENMEKFHRGIKFTIYQCNICREVGL